jgi:tetratricopeptide (TPR) repeat protein
MKQASKAKRWIFISLFIAFVLVMELLLIAPFFMHSNRKIQISGSSSTVVDSSLLPCNRVINVLENELGKIGEDGVADNYLERAKILNRMSIEACDDKTKERYFNRALSELQVADALQMLNAQLTDINQKIGFYWKERAEFFRMHQMFDREIDIYTKYLSLPGHSKDVYSLTRKAEVLARIGWISESISTYATVAEICRTSNNSNCYNAGSQFADLLEDNQDSPEIIKSLKTRWPKDSSLKDLFRYNGDASGRIRKVLMDKSDDE